MKLKFAQKQRPNVDGQKPVIIAIQFLLQSFDQFYDIWICLSKWQRTFSIYGDGKR